MCLLLSDARNLRQDLKPIQLLLIRAQYFLLMDHSIYSPSLIHRHLLQRLRYKHLQMLVVLDSCCNLNRAADIMHMSQPAASRMLQEIEDMFGCLLFERMPRGMRATALGERLIGFAGRSLNNLAHCMEELALQQQGGYGYLSLGTIMGAAPDLVMNAIARLKRDRPRLCIRVMGDTSDQLLRMLEQGRIDLAIARRSAEMADASFSFEALGNEKLRIVVRAGHALLQQQHIEWTGLLTDWPWILQATSSPARMALDQYLLQASLPLPANIIECNSVYSMLQLIQRTDSIMLLSETALQDYLQMGMIHTLPIFIDTPMAPFGILTRKHEPLTDEQRIFIAYLHDHAGD